MGPHQTINISACFQSYCCSMDTCGILTLRPVEVELISTWRQIGPTQTDGMVRMFIILRIMAEEHKKGHYLDLSLYLSSPNRSVCVHTQGVMVAPQATILLCLGELLNCNGEPVWLDMGLATTVLREERKKTTSKKRMSQNRVHPQYIITNTESLY